jgi:hypothetical protein
VTPRDALDGQLRIGPDAIVWTFAPPEARLARPDRIEWHAQRDYRESRHAYYPFLPDELQVPRQPINVLLADYDAGVGYLVESEHRQNYDFTPEASRRARGFAIYAALRSLGRNGLRDLVDRCCDHAAHIARLLRDGGAEILNEVNLNQVMVACEPEAVTRIQRDGTCWAGGTTWHGRHALRISVSGYGTTTEDIERSARAILANL